MRPLAKLAVAGLIMTGLTACGDVEDPASTTLRPSQTAPAPPTEEAKTTVAPGAPPRDSARETELFTHRDDLPDGLRDRADVQAAIDQEADRVGVRAEDVEVVGYADVHWPDGAIGCPEPGMMYTTVMVEGKVLLLSVEGQVASYHGTDEGEFFYCASPTPPHARILPTT